MAFSPAPMIVCGRLLLSNSDADTGAMNLGKSILALAP